MDGIVCVLMMDGAGCCYCESRLNYIPPPAATLALRSLYKVAMLVRVDIHELCRQQDLEIMTQVREGACSCSSIAKYSVSRSSLFCAVYSNVSLLVEDAGG